ncbi:MAG: histidine phosphatase family protein [Anaerolineae bacterium]|nr:histidine phosphatase family protein [Anaerolineae bacterium]
MTLTCISFVRHGQVYNPEQVVYGRLPGFGLSDLGQQQAQAAANALRDSVLAIMISSPLQRAQETAQILLTQHPGTPLCIEDAVNEVAFYFEGWPLHKMAARQWDLYSGVPAGYEQPSDVVTRVRTFLSQVRCEYAGRHIVVVSHGDVLAYTILWAYGVPLIPEKKHTLDQLGFSDDYPAPASITTFIYRPEDGEKPSSVEYLRPYGDALADTISPK